jgi:hypothetical protein
MLRHESELFESLLARMSMSGFEEPAPPLEDDVDASPLPPPPRFCSLKQLKDYLKMMLNCG